MSEVNATEVTIEANAGSAIATPEPQKAPVNVESDLTKALNAVLGLQKKNENPELVVVEPYVWEQHSARMIYFPYDMRAELNMIENCDGLVDPNSVYMNELDARYSPSRRKVIQREASVSGAVVYAYADKILTYFELPRDIDENDEDKADDIAFNAMREPIIKLVTENKAYFDEKLAKFKTQGDSAEVSVDELLAVMGTPGLLVEFNDPLGSSVALITKSATIQRTYQGTFIAVSGTIHLYNGKLLQSTYTFKIPVFGGRKTFTELGVRDLTNMQEERERLIARGKRYVDYTANTAYLQCNGMLVRRNWYGKQQFNAKGRCMVDFNAMKMMDDEYDAFFGIDRYRQVEQEAVTILTDEVYLTCAPFVYGFSLKVKKWGEMRMDDLEPVNFRDDAFDNLVMDDVRKNMILALVKTRFEGKRDIVEGKGGGTIFLLEGTPGVGKTLTAETVAEVLHRPLHMVSVGELGTSADQLEERLRKILDIATVWNAILLIDEADVFMEQRKADDIERNAMVGVFLRLLEYYEGILFLTTNRAANIDQAFYSRISMSIHFDPLDAEARFTIWENLLAVAGITTISEGDIGELCEYELNGRQIKNVINNARSLALHDGREVELSDMEMVIAVGEDFHDSTRIQEVEPEASAYLYEEEGSFRRFFRAAANFFKTLAG